MSLYQCEECGCCENTALGWYHYTEHVESRYKGRKLCSACAPRIFSDGSINEDGGKWHGKFEQKFYSLGSMETDEQGNLREKTVDSRKFFLLEPDRPAWKTHWRVYPDHGFNPNGWIGNGHKYPWFQVIALPAYSKLQFENAALKAKVEELDKLARDLRAVANGCWFDNPNLTEGIMKRADRILGFKVENNKEVSP